MLYLVTALCLVGSFIACKWLVGSKMGLVLTAMRDQEQRLRFLGYPIAQYKIFIFALAAALAGLSGALYAPQVGIITPSQIGVLPSLEVVVWVATGGRGTLIGALLGAVGINAARSLLTAYLSRVVADHPGRSVRRGRDPVSGRTGGHPQPATTASTTDPYAAPRALCAWFRPLWRDGSARTRALNGSVAPEVLCSWRRSVEKQGSIIYLEDITVSFDGFQVLRGRRFLR